MTLDYLKENIKSVPDFPKKGIMFRDINPILKDPDLFDSVVSRFDSYLENICKRPDAIVAADARGFIFGAALALRMYAPLVLVRKKGKLPPPVNSITYDLEYGTDTLEIASNALEGCKNVVFIDDLLATRGTAKASYDLIEKCGAKVMAALFLIELKEFNARSKFDFPVHCLVDY